MPYSCALAVCTTFCAHIAGALIPIFGPTFPSLCVPPEAPEHGRWTIDPALVIEATAEAESYRAQYSASSFSPTSSTTRDSYSPQARMGDHPMASMRATPPHSLGRRLRLKRAFGGESPYGTPTDTDVETNGSETSSGDGYFCSPVTPVSASSLNLNHQQSWRPHNVISHSANSSINVSPQKLAPGLNPILSAIPRSTGLVDVPMGGMWPATKRRVDEVDADDEYDGGESAVASITDDKASDIGRGSDREMEDVSSEKKAAWLLMKLSVKDGECAAEASREREVYDGPRVKRRRASN